MTTTTLLLPPPVQQKFSAKLLSTPQARLIHRAFATPKVLDEQSGDILRMRRYTRLETVPVPVNPAMMNPPSQVLNAVDIDARIDWYARYNWRSKTLSNRLGNPNGKAEGNKAEGENHRKRLNERAPKKVMRQSKLIGNYEREIRRGFPARKGHKSNRLTYIIITKQVKSVACSKPSLNILESLREAA